MYNNFQYWRGHRIIFSNKHMFINLVYFLTFLIKCQTFGHIYPRNYNTDDSQFIPRLAASWYFVCVQPHLGILRHAYRIHTCIPISCIPTYGNFFFFFYIFFEYKNSFIRFAHSEPELAYSSLIIMY